MGSAGRWHSPDAAAQAALQWARAGMEHAREPSVLADAVVDAVRTRRFLVADHEYTEAALRSLAGLLKGQNPVLPTIPVEPGPGG